jgi:hypothetical protein
MEIHGPEGPTNSFKDFLIHIVIVTIGILIALGLEGVRETIYVHRVVRDARENFRVELEGNRQNLDKELKNDTESLARVDKIVADLPTLRKDPAQFRARVAEVYPSGYFFSSSRWESALSTGALGHMAVDEVNQYAEANFLTHTYTALELQTNTDWQQLEAYVSSYETPTPQEMSTGVEKLYLYRADTRSLKQVGEEFSNSLNKALSQKPNQK